jgi:hypothetical protein
MELIEFAQQIEYLLFTGLLRGEQILRFHYLLKSYGQGHVSAEEVQSAIESVNPMGW